MLRGSPWKSNLKAEQLLRPNPQGEHRHRGSGTGEKGSSQAHSCWEGGSHIRPLKSNTGMGKPRQTLGIPQAGHLKDRPSRGLLLTASARLPW